MREKPGNKSNSEILQKKHKLKSGQSTMNIDLKEYGQVIMPKRNNPMSKSMVISDAKMAKVHH